MENYMKTHKSDNGREAIVYGGDGAYFIDYEGGTLRDFTTAQAANARAKRLLVELDNEDEE